MTARPSADVWANAAAMCEGAMRDAERKQQNITIVSPNGVDPVIYSYCWALYNAQAEVIAAHRAAAVQYRHLEADVRAHEERVHRYDGAA